jgi:hypothetical protein
MGSMIDPIDEVQLEESDLQSDAGAEERESRELNDDTADDISIASSYEGETAMRSKSERQILTAEEVPLNSLFRRLVFFNIYSD